MKKAILILGVLGVSGYVAYLYIIRQINLVKEFDYKIIGFNLMQVSKNQLAFSLKVRFYNKSAIEATINKLYTDVYLNDMHMGYFTDSVETVIPSKGNNEIDLFFSFNPASFLSNWTTILLGAITNKKITINFKGQASISTGFVNVMVPIEYQTDLKI